MTVQLEFFIPSLWRLSLVISLFSGLDGRVYLSFLFSVCTGLQLSKKLIILTIVLEIKIFLFRHKV